MKRGARAFLGSVAVVAVLLCQVPAGATHVNGCAGLIGPGIPGQPSQGAGSYPAAVELGPCVGFPGQSQGYAARGTWQIKVTRGFTVTTYDDTKSPPCLRSIMRSGDRIDITVTAGAMFVFFDSDVPQCPPAP